MRSSWWSLLFLTFSVPGDEPSVFPSGWPTRMLWLFFLALISSVRALVSSSCFSSHANCARALLTRSACGVFEGGRPGSFSLLETSVVEQVLVVLTVSYTHLRAHETPEHLVCRL